MAKYLIKDYEVQKLFCRMVAKREKLPLETVKKKDTLDKKLRKYSPNIPSEEFAQKAFGLDDKGNTIWPTVMKNFASAINSNTSMSLTHNRLMYILRYLDDVESINQYDKIVDNLLFKAPKDSILNQFGNATWFLYYRNSSSEFNGNELHPIVCRVLLHLHDNYKTMSIYNVAVRAEGIAEDVFYEGRYYVRGNRYLFVEGRVSNERELRIIFDTKLIAELSNGTETILGYYLNASNNVSFGPIVIEKTNTPIPKENEPFEFKIFTREKQTVDGERIPPAIWDVLSKEYRVSLPEALK